MNKLVFFLTFFSLTACGAFLGSKSVPANTVSPEKDLDSVNGAVTVGENSHVDKLSTVNGSIKVGGKSQVGEVETVNGSIQFADEVSAKDVETVNGSIRLGKQCKIEGSAETVNGSVVAGRGCNISGDMETVNGAIKATGSIIKGKIETVNGTIKLLDGTHVYEDIVVNKPSGFWNKKNKRIEVYLGKNVEVDGDLIFERPVRLMVHETAEYDDIEGDDVDVVKVSN